MSLAAFSATPQAKASPRLCALLTCFNRADKTLASLAALQVAAANAGLSVSAVLVDDGSTDGTGEELQALAASDPGLKVIVLPHNQGKGGAMMAGLRTALQLGYTHALQIDAKAPENKQ